jgi:hypothetical protein
MLFVLLAQVHTEQGRLAIAENSPMHALAIEPQNYEANFLLAKLYFKTNLPNLAKQRMESRKPAQGRGRRQIDFRKLSL